MRIEEPDDDGALVTVVLETNPRALYRVSRLLGKGQVESLLRELTDELETFARRVESVQAKHEGLARKVMAAKVVRIDRMEDGDVVDVAQRQSGGLVAPAGGGLHAEGDHARASQGGNPGRGAGSNPAVRPSPWIRRESMRLSKEVIEGLSPGVRDLVVYLNNELGYPTTDSGDGSNHASGMECALPFPMVAMDVSNRDPVGAARALAATLLLEGLRFRPADDDGPRLEVSYSPHDDVAMLLLFNVTSDMLPACRGAAERGLRAPGEGRGGSICTDPPYGDR